MILSLSAAIDSINPDIARHHRRVSYIAAMLGKKLGYKYSSINEIIMAGALQNIGSLVATDRIELIDHKKEQPFITAEYGYRALKVSRHFGNVAKFIRYHNHPDVKCDSEDMPNECKLLNLASKIEVQMKDESRIMFDRHRVTGNILRKKDEMPSDLVNAFAELSEDDYFWLNMQFNKINEELSHMASNYEIEMSEGELIDMSGTLSRITDYRSRFTAAHSGSVSAISGLLAITQELTIEECLLMRVAGNLHNLGKAAVPPSITEKKGALSDEELKIIRTQGYHIDRMLEPVKSLSKVRTWISGRNNTTYQENNSTGNNILNISNIYSALREDRPHRKALSKKEAVEEIRRMINDNKINKRIFESFINNIDTIEDLRKEAVNKSKTDYERFINLENFY